VSTWLWLLVAGASAYAVKLAGYLLPQRWLDRPAIAGLAAALTVGLLASLTASNAATSGQALVVDSRLLAVVVAGLALWRKVPFIVVVILGALVAAAGRLAGLP